MNRKKFLFPFLFFTFCLAFFQKPAQSQLILGQYTDEAPFRTWNILGIATASALAMGNTHFASSADCSASLINPALLSKLPKFSFILSSSSNTASFFRYSIVNTGVLFSAKGLPHSFLAFDFAGVSIKIRNWVIAVNKATLENYSRPEAELEQQYRNSPYYSLSFSQKGALGNINIALSRKLHKKLAVGIGFNFLSGSMEKNLEEKWLYPDITIIDRKSHDFKGFYINGGFYLDFSDKATFSLIFRTPYQKKSQSESLLRYQAPAGNTDIRIESSANNSYKLPLVLGIGLHYNLSKSFQLASDFSFFNWSRYEIQYFEEKLKRDFKDIVKASAGVEYSTYPKIFNQNIKISYRAGVGYDPQPIKDLNSYYLYLSLGSGISFKKFFLDAGILIGKEYGSRTDLTARVVAVTVGYK